MILYMHINLFLICVNIFLLFGQFDQVSFWHHFVWRCMFRLYNFRRRQIVVHFDRRIAIDKCFVRQSNPKMHATCRYISENIVLLWPTIYTDYCIIQLHKERMKFRSSWLRYVTHIHRRCSLCTKLNTLRSSSLKCGETHLSMLITLREYTCLSTRAHYSNSEPTSIYFFFFNHR